MNNHALKTWVVLTKEIGNRCERFRIVMIATAVFMLIANGYSWFAFYPSHDNILGMLWNSFPRCVSLGRFLVPIYLSVRGQGALPLVTGLLSVVYLGISTCLVTALLRQKSQVELVLTSALLSANLFMVEINTAQAYCRDLFLFALMLNCFGSYFVWRQRNMKGFLASVGLFFVAFGIYPAFLTTAVCLIVSATTSNGCPDCCPHCLSCNGAEPFYAN